MTEVTQRWCPFCFDKKGMRGTWVDMEDLNSVFNHLTYVHHMTLTDVVSWLCNKVTPNITFHRDPYPSGEVMLD